MRRAIGELDPFDDATTTAASLSLSAIDRQLVGKVSALAIDVDIELIESSSTGIHCALHHHSN